MRLSSLALGFTLWYKLCHGQRPHVTTVQLSFLKSDKELDTLGSSSLNLEYLWSSLNSLFWLKIGLPHIFFPFQTLFDPINPDKDTVATRQYNRRERLDNEFWLVQKLAGVMERANFHELPKATVHRALSEHNTRERVMV